MISSARVSSAATLVLEKDDGGLSPRIIELRNKIHNSEYLENAIMRIAQVISNKLVENSEELRLREEL